MTHVSNIVFEQALEDLQSGKDLTGKNGVLMPLIKQLTEAALKAVVLGQSKINMLLYQNPDRGEYHLMVRLPTLSQE